MFCYSNNISQRVAECTPDIFKSIIDNPRVGDICAEIADAREKKLRGEMSREDFETLKSEQKRRLPVFCFHATFPNGRRVNADAVPSGLSIYDLDHIADARGRWMEIEPRVRELGIVLAHVSPSGEGLRLVFVLPEGMGLAEGQRWMATQLGDREYDESVKDYARCSFAVPRSYILHCDEEELFKERHVAPTPIILTPITQHPTPITQPPSPTTPSPKSLHIFDLCRREAGLANIDINRRGSRHTSLQSIMSAGASRLMSESELRAVIGEKMPEYAQEQDCSTLIRDFYAKYHDESKVFNTTVQKILAEAERSSALAEIRSQTIDGEEEYEDTLGQQGEAKNTPGEQRLEKLLCVGLKESVVGVPEKMQMPVLCAVLPLAGAYADGVEVEYCDGKRMRLGLMSIVVGPQASGKSACKEVLDAWLTQMVEEDALARKKEDEWKVQRRSRKANEKAPKDPEVMIRNVPVTISCSTLLKRMKNAQGHALYSFGEELDTLRKTNGAGSWSSKYDIYRLGFDNGRWGQDYNSDQAESGVVDVVYNWSILGTYGALRKCFRHDNVENGLSSRVIVSQMPDNSFAPMPRFRGMTDEQRSVIDEAVTSLRQAQGFVDTPRLRKTIARWVEDKRLLALRKVDTVMDTYRKRAAVIGFRCGVIYRLLCGKESKSCLHFAELMADYVLREQIAIFGETLLQQVRQVGDGNERRSENKSIFDILPSTFSLSQLEALKESDTSSKTLRVIVHRWKADGWIEKVGKDVWKKLKD